MNRRKKSDAELMGSVEAYRSFDDDKFDPESLLNNLEAAIVNNFNFDVTSQFDEREIPRYANFFEFTRRGLNIELYPVQLKVIMQAYGEICPFCSDQKWVDTMFDQPMPEIMEHVVFTRFGRCPKCKQTRLDQIKQSRWYFPNRIVLLVGQRAGKNVVLGATSLYQDHLYLTLERDKNGERQRVAPYEYFDMPPTFVRQAFTGVTAQQAFDNIWYDRIVSMRNESPWYKSYFEFLNYHGQRLGQELFKISDTYISYHHKRMGSTIKAPDLRRLRGATRYFTGIDEICLFNAQAEMISRGKKVGDVAEVWKSFNNSLRTIRTEADRKMREGYYDVPQAISMDISSPFDVNDILSQHIRESRINPRIMAAHYATWEFNPKQTREALAEEFVSDPEAAWRDFGAIPPLANSPWMTDKKTVIGCVRQTPDPIYVTYRVAHGTNEQFGDSTTWLELDKTNLTQTAHVIGIDLGLDNNAFALSIGSLEAGNRIRIDCAFMLKPMARSKINLDKMFTQFIEPLAMRSNCVLLAYDHWNSISNVQHLRDAKIDARQYTLSPVDFALLRSDFTAGTISLPFAEYPLASLLERESSVDLVQTSYDKPHFSLVLQTLTVREIGGGKVVKPQNGDDDVFRSMAMAHHFVSDPDIKKRLMAGGLGNGTRGATTRTLGVITHASRGAGSSSAGGTVGRFMAVASRSTGRTSR